MKRNAAALATLARYIEAGLSCREIAARLGVSPATAIRWTQQSGLTSQRSRRLPAEARRRLSQRLREGVSPAVAAAEFGVSPRTAARLVDPALAARRRRDLRERVWRAVGEGASFADAAAQAGVSASTAARWTREAGVAKRRQRAGRHEEAKAFAAVEAGMTLDEAAQTFALGSASLMRLRTRLTPARMALRKRLLSAIESGLSCRKAAALVEMPVATAIRWARRAIN